MDAILFGKDLQYTNSSNELSAHSPSEDWPLTWQWLGAENGEDFIFEQHQKRAGLQCTERSAARGADL